MNQTGQGGRMMSLSPNAFVEISPELAAERALNEGEWVRITSRRGSLDVPVVITERVAGNVLFMPIHHGKDGVNALTGEHHDPDVNTPAYKEIAVNMKRVDRQSQPNPVPLHNFRHGSRTPLDHLPIEQNGSRQAIGNRLNMSKNRRNSNGRTDEISGPANTH